MHLIVDSRNCGRLDLLNEPDRLKECLTEMVDQAGMHRFGDPTILDYPFPGQDGTALSAVVFLGESSLTVHTYPEQKSIFIDIFHCASFDAAQILEWVIERFEMDIGQTDTFLFVRGLDKNGVPEITRPLVWNGVALAAAKVNIKDRQLAKA